MFCIKCHHPSTHVTNSRPHKKTPHIWRRRKCPSCDYTFTTREEIALEDYILIENENFSTLKLAFSLVEFLPDNEPAETAYWLARTVGEELVMSKLFTLDTSTLLDSTKEVLGRYDPTARIKFELKYGLITPTASPRRGRPRLKR